MNLDTVLETQEEQIDWVHQVNQPAFVPPILVLGITSTGKTRLADIEIVTRNSNSEIAPSAIQPHQIQEDAV
jgi:hypothetical protein